jgi:hypothetical protein
MEVKKVLNGHSWIMTGLVGNLPFFLIPATLIRYESDELGREGRRIASGTDRRDSEGSRLSRECLPARCRQWHRHRSGARRIGFRCT